MKIALRGPIAWRTAPRHDGPWEQTTGLLADGLAQRGIDVPLFATLDSITLARLEGICARPPYEEDDQIDGRVWEALHVPHALSRSAGFDLIATISTGCRRPFRPGAGAVGDHHPSVSSPRILPAYLRSNGVLVSISDADRAPELEYAAQSITASRSRPYGSRATASEALVRLGRIHPDKGTARAIEIARRADRPLVRCGQVQDERYFIDEIEPHVAGDSVRYLGSVGGLERAQVRCEAACLLHPIAFGELFGLSIVESMLCRTPVVAYARGSMPEVIQEGVTGVLADSVESAVAGVKRAVRLGRAACRQAAEQRISADEVVDS